MAISEHLRGDNGEPQHGTSLWTHVDGAERAVFVSDDAVAFRLGRPRGTKLMVEESSDFISAHRELIIKAACRKLRREHIATTEITLGWGDL
jgi:hypothetical protein